MPTDERPAVEPLLGFADTLPAASADGSAPAPMLHLLTFALDREEFGIPVTQVREVIRVNGITRVPQVPAHVRGVTNLRGRILAYPNPMPRVRFVGAKHRAYYLAR